VSGWAVSLGMHNFRRVERETLRVLETDFPVAGSMSCKGETSLPVVKNPSVGGVASSKRLSPRKRSEKVKPVWSELPLAYVRPTRSRFRRLRKVKSRRTSVRASDSKAGTVWDVIPVQAKAVKIPVMGATVVPKDVRYWSLSFKEKEAVVKFWLRARIRRCRPIETVFGRFPSYTAFGFTRLYRKISIVFDGPSWKLDTPRREVVSFPKLSWRGDEIVTDLVGRCYEALKDVLLQGQLNKKESCERIDANRQTNRRHWLRWMIWKKLSERVKRSYTKRQLRQTLWKVLSRRHGFHTLWLQSELANLYGSTIKESVRGRDGRAVLKLEKPTRETSSHPESTFDFSELRRSRYWRNRYGTLSSRVGVKAQSHEIALKRPYGC